MDRILKGRGVVVAALVVVGVVTGGLWLVGAGFQMVLGVHEVGPDADEMANDPVLHLQLDDATPGDIVTHTGSDGGVMPAMANRTSEAFRFWNTEAGNARSVLVAAVRAADAEGVVWSKLYCVGPSAVFDGRKRLTVDGEALVASVEVRIDPAPATLDREGTDLLISLSSDGFDRTPTAPHSDTPPAGDPCPAELTALFAELGG